MWTGNSVPIHNPVNKQHGYITVSLIYCTRIPVPVHKSKLSRSPRVENGAASRRRRRSAIRRDTIQVIGITSSGSQSYDWNNKLLIATNDIISSFFTTPLDQFLSPTCCCCGRGAWLPPWLLLITFPFAPLMIRQILLFSSSSSSNSNSI